MRHQANAGKALTDVRRPVAVDTHGRRGGRRRLIPADFVLAAIGIPLLGLAACGRPHRCRRSSSLDLKQAGVVLAVTVLIGTIVIRSVLLQAVMAVLGERNGCLPRRLPWLPRLGLDAPAAPEQATAARPALTAAPCHRRGRSKSGQQARAVKAHNQGKDGPLRGAMPGMKLGAGRGLAWFAVVSRDGAGRKVHAGSGVPSVVTGSLWTVRGRNQVWCWDPRCGSCLLLLRARVSVS